MSLLVHAHTHTRTHTHTYTHTHAQNTSNSLKSNTNTTRESLLGGKVGNPPIPCNQVRIHFRLPPWATWQNQAESLQWQQSWPKGVSTDSLCQWFSECRSWTSNQQTWERVRNASSLAPSQTESETPGVGPKICVLTSPTGDSDAQNHWFMYGFPYSPIHLFLHLFIQP